MRTETSPRRVLLGFGSAASSHEAAELARAFVQEGAEVQVVLTAAAEGSIQPAALQAITGRVPRSRLFDAAHEAAMGHIELARWPDAVVIAGASAELLAAMAMGLADDLLTTLYLATDKPVFVAPALGAETRLQPATRAHCTLLTQRGVRFIEPDEAAPAAGGTATGDRADVLAIRHAVWAALLPGRVTSLTGLHAVVTAGPTREAIDAARFISNRSSGKQGFGIAEALRQAGARVTLVTGPTRLAAHADIRRIDVESAQQMLAASLQAAESADLLVAAAAVADYRMAPIAAPGNTAEHEHLTLQLLKNPDILATVRAAHPKLFLVGFAAETEKLEAHARDKLARKGLDLIAANWVGEGRAFDTDDNALSVYWADGQQQIAHASKTEVARQLVAIISARYAKRA